MSKPFILCVDDEKIVTDSLISQLRYTFGENYEYEAASDVDEAFEVVGELEEDGEQLALIVSDWLMPKVKGDKFLRAMYERDPKVGLIMLSGQADQDAIDELEQIVPEFVFIRKPWIKDELMGVIKEKLKI